MVTPSLFSHQKKSSRMLRQPLDAAGDNNMRSAFVIGLLAAFISGCGGGGESVLPAPTIKSVQWHLGAPDSNRLSLSASTGPEFLYFYVTVEMTDGTSEVHQAVGSCSTAQRCEFKPGDLLGLGPPVGYRIELAGDINSASLSGHNVSPAPPIGADPFAILLNPIVGNDPPFKVTVNVTTEGFQAIKWTVEIAP